MSFWSLVADILTAPGNNITAPVGAWEDRIRGMETLTEDAPGLSARAVRNELKRHGIRMGRWPERVNGQLVLTVDDRDRARDIIRSL